MKRYKLTIFIVLMLGIFSWVYGTHFLSTRTDVYRAQAIAPSLTNLFGLPSGYSVLDLFFNPSAREFYWGTAIGVIKHYPWFGCGYSAYVQTLRDRQTSHTEYPHNSLLHITAELGVAGLILYGWFFIALWLKIKDVLHAISREDDLFLIGCGIASGILAWMLHSLLDTAWASLQLGVLWWLFIGILFSLVYVLFNEGEKSCP